LPVHSCEVSLGSVRRLEMESAISLHGGNPEPVMSALGHKRKLRHLRIMSALPPKADIPLRDGHVRLVPQAEIPTVFWVPVAELFCGRGCQCFDDCNILQQI
jgi:hypothetical protein